MKPSFALNLSHEGLSLLHRAAGGWRIIGEVDLDDPALTEKLGYLRKTAAELAGGQLAAKLVIPNSQILYRTVDLHGTNGGQREQVIHDALEGATPYGLDDLVYDWTNAGNGVAHVAAVARETLVEAEDFAVQHRFNPVSFVSIPEPDFFNTEPFFGPSKFSHTLLQAGETVERDRQSIEIIGRLDPVAKHIPPAPPETTAEQSDDPAREQSQADVKTPIDADTTDVAPDNDKSVPASKPSDDTTPDDRFDVSAGFSSRRKDGATGDANDILKPTTLDSIEPRFALYGQPNQPETSPQAPEKQPKITPVPVTAPTLTGAMSKRKRKKPTPKVTATPSPAVIPPAPPAPPAQSRDNEADSMTVFGTRKNPYIDEKSGFSGRFLVAAVAGLLGLVVLALLLISGPPSWLGGRDNVPVASVPVAPSPVENIPQTISPDIGAAPEQTTPPAATPEPDTAPVGTAQVQATAPTGESPPFSIDQAEAFHTQTGIWARAPQPPLGIGSDGIDDLYVASIDRQVLSHDAVALPGTNGALPDAPPPGFLPPPPAGTRFDLDARGLVKPRPDGALTPEGIRIFSGRPDTVPRLRPRSIEPEIIAPIAPEAPRPGTRPLARPDNLVETNERSLLGGRSRTELAKLRPLARPESTQEAQSQDQTPTELAVLQSSRPRDRPANFAETVNKAIIAAAVTSADSSNTVVASAATAATPRIPNIPTRASVAREATYKNALNLSKVNLIGIYGSSKERRALVRLRNGRYIKVQVGDRLDGGKVAAIGANALRYIKGRRTLTLEMPKG